MYLEKQEIDGGLNYFICETFNDRRNLNARTLFDLGTNPSNYIIYPGGNSYYIHESVELSMIEKGYKVDTFEIEAIFWPFLEPRIKMMLREPSRGIKREYCHYKRYELYELQSRIHIFDKRRLHFLRFGIINQSDIKYVPYRSFSRLLGRSREEIECMIDEEEKSLGTSELKVYVYTIFNLQRHFNHPYATSAPQMLDQDILEDYFLKELCIMNLDKSFFISENNCNRLHNYLAKYLILFFDNDFSGMSFDYFSSFRNNFNQQLKQNKKTLSISEACKILDISEREYSSMTKKQVIRRFRKLAHICHPDKGGTDDKFVKLCEAYERLLEGKEDL